MGDHELGRGTPEIISYTKYGLIPFTTTAFLQPARSSPKEYTQKHLECKIMEAVLAGDT